MLILPKTAVLKWKFMAQIQAVAKFSNYGRKDGLSAQFPFG